MASRQRKAYCRKLLLAHSVSTGRHDLRSLEACTHMPRRTLQDSLADLGDIGIACTFVQDGQVGTKGRCTSKRLPLPGSEWTRMWPPMASVRWRQIASPSPVPP